MRIRIFYFAYMKTGKNCHFALIGCNRSKSRPAAKNQSNFGAEKKK